MPRHPLLMAVSAAIASSASAQYAHLSVRGFVETVADALDRSNGDSDHDAGGAVFGSFQELPIASGSFAPVGVASAGGNAHAQGRRGFGQILGFVEGSASANAVDEGLSEGSGRAGYELEFTLDTASDFTLDWALDANGVNTVGLATLVFEGPGGVLLSKDSGAGFQSGTIGGVLDPGDYTLVLHSDALARADGFLDNTESATAFAAFTLAVVPNPGTLAVVGAAGAAFLRRRRGGAGSAGPWRAR